MRRYYAVVYDPGDSNLIWGIGCDTTPRKAELAARCDAFGSSGLDHDTQARLKQCQAEKKLYYAVDFYGAAAVLWDIDHHGKATLSGYPTEQECAAAHMLNAQYK